MSVLTRAAGLAAAALMTAGLALGAAKKEEPAIWTIQKPNGTTVTFFGSVHLLLQMLDQDAGILHSPARQGNGFSGEIRHSPAKRDADCR